MAHEPAFRKDEHGRWEERIGGRWVSVDEKDVPNVEALLGFWKESGIPVQISPASPQSPPEP